MARCVGIASASDNPRDDMYWAAASSSVKVSDVTADGSSCDDGGDDVTEEQEDELVLEMTKLTFFFRKLKARH